MTNEEANRLLQTLGLIPADEPAEEAEGISDFDGGARETVPTPADPEADHNQLILEALQNMPGAVVSSGERPWREGHELDPTPLDRRGGSAWRFFLPRR